MVKVSSQAAKNAFRWRYFVSALRDVPLEAVTNQVMKQASSWRSVPQVWFVVTIGAFALLYWNGRLLFATGAGVAVMLLVYLMHDWQPRVNLSQLRKFLRGWNQPFVVSAGAGAIATLAIYLASSIWVDSESPWVASGALLQGAGTLTVLLLLIGQMLDRQTRQEQIQYKQLVRDLLHQDPLKRLIAVRQLTDALSVIDRDSDAGAGTSKAPSRREVAGYFRLMLGREPEPTVREALLDGLQTIDLVHQLKQATEPLVQLAPRKRSPVKTGRVAPVRVTR